MNLSASKVLLCTAVTGIMTCSMAATAFAADLGVGTVTASALKLRAEASTSADCITLLAQGTAVVVQDTAADGWYKVSYEGETGYLSSEYVSFAAAGSAKLGNGLCTGSSVNVRSAASTDASKVGVLNKGEVVSIVGIDNGWYKVSYDNITGYVSGDYMETTKQALSSRGKTTEDAKKSTSSSKGSEIAAFAKKYLGVRYVYGGSSGKGFDCSGFTMHVMKNFGVSLPHTATGQLGHGTSVAKSELQAGDLVFFCDPARAKGKAASHAGIYIGNNQFIHASSGGGKVQIDSLSKAYYAQYYVGARRVVK